MSRQLRLNELFSSKPRIIQKHTSNFTMICAYCHYDCKEYYTVYDSRRGYEVACEKCTERFK